MAQWIVAVLLLVPHVAKAQYTIRTYAGGGPPDGSLASAVGVHPTGVAVDRVGNLYISDSYRRVYKVTNAGVISLYAGNGDWGFSGDGGRAVDAQLASPLELATDSSGNLYISDLANSRVRRVSTSGIITTVAGNGTGRPFQDGVPAVNSALDNPRGLVVDNAGNLYIAEALAHRVRKVTTDGVIHTVAGNGVRGLSGDGGPASNASLGEPYGLAMDEGGNLYIGELFNCRVRRVSPSGIITTVAGTSCGGYSRDGGPATGAMLTAAGIAVDSNGNLYVADRDTRIRKVATNGIITTVAGNGVSGYGGDGGAATSAMLRVPWNVAVDLAGNVYFTDDGNLRVRKVSSGIITTAAGTGGPSYSGDGGPATKAQLSVAGVAVSSGGDLFVADSANYRVRRVSPAGVISTFAGSGNCCALGDGGPATNAWLSAPSGVALDSVGTVYIADTFNDRIRAVSGGTIRTIAGNGVAGHSGDGGPATGASLYRPVGIAVDSNRNVYIAEIIGHRIRKVTSNGIISTVAGTGIYGYSGDGGPAANAQINRPGSVAVDLEGNLFIADTGNRRIRKVDTNGIISTVAGSANLVENPTGVAVDQTGVLYITTSTRVWRLDQGVLTAIAGNGTSGFSGDGGPALSASFQGAGSIAIGLNGQMYVADQSRVRILESNLTVSGPVGWFIYAVGSNPPSPREMLVTGPAAIAVTAQVTTGAEWLTVTPSSGTTPANFQVGIRTSGIPSGSFLTLSGNIRVSSAHTFVDVPITLHVTPCTTNLGGARLNVSAAGSTERIPVTGSCPWTGTSNAGWITMVSPSGTGAWYATARIDPNTGPARSGTITFTGNQTFTINQDAPAGGTPGLRFVPAVPCRIADTRNAAGAFGGPRMNGGETRRFSIPVSNCSIPWKAAAYSLNVTAVPAGALSYLSLWPAGKPKPLVSTLNSFDGRVKANAAIVPAGTDGAVNVFVTDAADVVLDINGYFVPPDAGGASFYPLEPCRVADTRMSAAPGPGIAGGRSRTFTVAGNCSMPSNAQAYSLNLTAVPWVSLSYLTVWPTGMGQPLVSTLNAPTGAITPNAAIVPAGYNGGIDVYVTNNSDLVIDANGYFAAPGGTGALSFYPVTPCRISDTRTTNGPFGGPILAAGEARAYVIPSSTCGIPAAARAYSLNVTTVPAGPLSYLTIWPSGLAQPWASTLNSSDGTVVSNATLVPGSGHGAISVYVTNSSHVILDINGYFQ
ncbi:MAG: hypothetical protein HY820_27840 [Acidobacteria bacterium]|nr:hypothetical protein [Acidobacteriota bacterium]